VVVWDAATGDKVLSLEGHKELASAIAFSPDGKWLASGQIEEGVLKTRKKPMAGP
jgi:WD40 repeat protein